MKRRKIKDQMNKMLFLIKILYYIQVVLFIVMLGYIGIRYFLYGEMMTGFDYTLLLIPTSLNVLISGYVMVKDGSIFRSLSHQIEIKDDSYKNIEKLNRDLRSQRHDFLNHIQVLYSLMELGEYEETSRYLNRLYGDVGKLSANIKTKSIAVNALIQAKSNEAAIKGVVYQTSINTRLEAMNMPDWELCRVLSNLIDNALEAALAMPNQRYVLLTLKENITDYLITIENPALSPMTNDLKELLKAGVTTKKDKEDHGMGLYITDQLLTKYDNSIELSFDDEVMSVVLTIHKLTV